MWQAATEQPLGENRRGARARVYSGPRARGRRTCRARRLVIGHQGALARTGGRDARETRRPGAATAPPLTSRAPGLPRLEGSNRFYELCSSPPPCHACVFSRDAAPCLPMLCARATLSRREAAAQQAALNLAPTLEERLIPGPRCSAVLSLLFVAWLQPHSSGTANARLFHSTRGADALFAGGCGTPTCSAARSKSQLLPWFLLAPPCFSVGARSPGFTVRHAVCSSVFCCSAYGLGLQAAVTHRAGAPCACCLCRAYACAARSEEPTQGPATSACVENLLLTWRPGADSASKEQLPERKRAASPSGVTCLCLPTHDSRARLAVSLLRRSCCCSYDVLFERMD